MLFVVCCLEYVVLVLSVRRLVFGGWCLAFVLLVVVCCLFVVVVVCRCVLFVDC